MATILVPMDTSRSAERVLEGAAKLAGGVAGRLLLFHVVEPVATYVPVGASMDVIATTPPMVGPDQSQAAIKRLEELAGPLRAGGLEVECDAIVGMAVDEILERARSRGVDYIVLGSHGHGALFHLFSGSVVTGVLKHTPCPVVVVPVRD